MQIKGNTASQASTARSVKELGESMVVRTSALLCVCVSTRYSLSSLFSFSIWACWATTLVFSTPGLEPSIVAWKNDSKKKKNPFWYEDLTATHYAQLLHLGQCTAGVNIFYATAASMVNNLPLCDGEPMTETSERTNLLFEHGVSVRFDA